MKNILLVSPYSDNELLWVTGEESTEVRNNFPPLGLATVAALTPKEGFAVRLWDENVHGQITAESRFDPAPDLVGITGYKHHLPRAREVARVFRDRGALAAIGGPGVSSAPAEYRQDFDILFVNEAEHTWPEFLAEWQAGRHRAEYRQIEKPDLDESPAPCWDSMAGDMKRYALGTVQTTRGCPFDCEFCDVIYLFGRRPRHKPVARVLEEVQAQADFGLLTIFFCDDEFSGDKRYAKQVLREIIALNDRRRAEGLEPLTFSTQMSIAVSSNEEFLRLLSEANFDLVFMGIESPNPESLKGANKVQNLKGDMVRNVHEVLSNGIGIRAGMIVGFDDDDRDIFEFHHRFIQESCLTSVAINMLKAPLGTPLWTRMMREGRVVNMAKNVGLGHSRTHTNILPKRMSRVELMEGYRWLLGKVYSWPSFEERIRGFVELVRRPPEPDARAHAVSAEEMVARVGVSGDGAEAIHRIIDHTRATAPGLLRRVRTLTLQHHRYMETVTDLMPQLDRHIERERAGDILLIPDDRATPPPVAFRAAFDEVFPETHRRVYLSLTDVAGVPRCLTDIFLDFLVRWGEEFTALEEHHRLFLHELSDRTCAKMNGVPPDEFEPFGVDEREVPNIKRIRLADDIFRNVWNELSDLRRGDRQDREVRATA